MSLKVDDAASLACVWRFTPESAPNEETRLIALLDGIGRTGSIAAAARELGMSYRHAWGRIDRWQGHFGRELVASGRGSGSRLSPFAAQLVTLDAQVRRRLAPHLAAADLEMAEILAGRPRGTHLRLRLVASHDLAVGSLADLMRARGHEVDLHFRGSVEAVAALAEGGCDAAGFHCPGGDLGRRVWSQYRRQLSARIHQLLRVCDRVQGLMVPAGNPKRLREVRDLARPDVRFLNRQPGAGTRMVFDLLLQEHGLKPGHIRGYTSEEHTHAAVAALIAGGEADAGLGIEAAARRFRLDFVPLIEEAYYFGFPRKSARSPEILGLAEALESPEFRQAVAAMPGYDATGSGDRLSVLAVDKALQVGET